MSKSTVTGTASTSLPDRFKKKQATIHVIFPFLPEKHISSGDECGPGHNCRVPASKHSGVRHVGSQSLAGSHQLFVMPHVGRRFKVAPSHPSSIVKLISVSLSTRCADAAAAENVSMTLTELSVFMKKQELELQLRTEKEREEGECALLEDRTLCRQME